MSPRRALAVNERWKSRKNGGHNGRGIPSDRKRWLFEQNPQTGQATGLELVMAKDVVLAHNGSVEVESRAGVGTAITLRLPRA